MALGHGSSIVRDGLVLHLDAANPRSRLGSNIIIDKSLSQFPANQNVTVTKVGNAIFATSNQNTSTPGVWPIGSGGGWITVSANTQYTFRALASIVSGSTAYLYISGNVTGNLVWQGNAVTSAHQWVENNFNTGSNTQLKVGILWSGPTIGSTIMIEDVGLHKTDSWYDLSGNGNNGTIFGVTYNSDNSGSMLFDASSEYVSFPNPLNQSQLNQIWTVQSWINITSKPPQTLIGGLGLGMFVEYTQGNNSLLYLNSGTNDYYTYGGQFTAQGWVMCTFRFNNSNGARQIWRNTTNISTSGPNNTSTPIAQSSTFTLGTANANTVQGKVSNLMIYNRYISDSEIQQNFEATRKRYGV